MRRRYQISKNRVWTLATTVGTMTTWDRSTHLSRPWNIFINSTQCGSASSFWRLRHWNMCMTRGQRPVGPPLKLPAMGSVYIGCDADHTTFASAGLGPSGSHLIHCGLLWRTSQLFDLIGARVCFKVIPGKAWYHESHRRITANCGYYSLAEPEKHAWIRGLHLSHSTLVVRVGRPPSGTILKSADRQRYSLCELMLAKVRLAASPRLGSMFEMRESFSLCIIMTMTHCRSGYADVCRVGQLAD